MSYARPLYKHLASMVGARLNCKKSGNTEWFQKHEESIEFLVNNFMPSGSGIDSGTKIDLEKSTGEKLVFYFGFHHMDENGMYDGWTDHTLTVMASLQFDIVLRISGSDRNHVKEYLYEVYSNALWETIDHNRKEYFSPSLRKAQKEYQERNQK